MADYIYLLENRLSPAQNQALATLREITRGRGLTLFLVGGAVRDLTSGSPVRDLDVAVQGNASKLKRDMELAGAVIVGSNEVAQTLHLRFPGGVLVEVGSTMAATYPKPGKPVLKPGTILEDLRRRDFTANAMALSLNEGSYGLLMDPLNGVADIENRELRLVSNYGFIEEPVRLIRATRFAARLGWTLEEKTQGRYDTAKQEGYISGLQEMHRGYEAEEIVHEEDPLRVMRRLEAEGWMQVVAPAWNSSKANVAELEKVRESQTQLQLQGIHPDAATVNFPLLTAKMAAKDVQALKASFPRQGFVGEIEALEGEAKEFAGQLAAKSAASASASYRLIHAAKPEAVLYVAYTTKSGAVQAKFKSFFSEWPQVRQKIPLTLMAEMRITPELPGYEELVEKIFFELMDGHLATAEEMRTYLEPYSPPAPPPPVHLRRPRAARKDAKKGRLKKGAAVAADDGEEADDVDPDDSGPDLDTDDEAEDEVESLGGGDFENDAGPLIAGMDDDDEDEDEDTADPVKKDGPADRMAGAANGKGGRAADKVDVPVAEEKGAAGGRKKVEAPDAAVGTVAAVKAVAAKAPVKAVAAKAMPPRTIAVKAVPAKAVAAKAIAVKAVAVKVVAAKGAGSSAGSVGTVKAVPAAVAAKASKAPARRGR